MNESQIEDRVMQVHEAMIGLPMTEVMTIATAMLSVSIKASEDRAERQMMFDSVTDTLRGLCDLHDC